MDMREAVIREVNSALAEVGIPKGWQWDVFEVVKITDRILAIPELRDALELLKAQRDMLFGGAGFVKIERVAPEEVYIKPPEPPQF